MSCVFGMSTIRSLIWPGFIIVHQTDSTDADTTGRMLALGYECFSAIFSLARSCIAFVTEICTFQINSRIGLRSDHKSIPIHIDLTFAATRFLTFTHQTVHFNYLEIWKYTSKWEIYRISKMIKQFLIMEIKTNFSNSKMKKTNAWIDQRRRNQNPFLFIDSILHRNCRLLFQFLSF